MSNDYISVSESHPHCLLIVPLPCRIHKLDVDDLVENNDDVKHVYRELSHSEKVDDELSIESVESDEGLKREVLFYGDKQVEEHKADLFFYDTLDNGLDLPVQNVDDLCLFLWISDHGPYLDNRLYVLKKLIVQKMVVMK